MSEFKVQVIKRPGRSIPKHEGWLRQKWLCFFIFPTCTCIACMNYSSCFHLLLLVLCWYDMDGSFGPSNTLPHKIFSSSSILSLFNSAFVLLRRGGRDGQIELSVYFHFYNLVGMSFL